MLFKSILIFGIILSLNLVQAERFSFDGYKLVRLTPKTKAHLNLISEWENNKDFDLWGTIKGVDQSVSASLSPQAFLKYKQFFSMFNLPYEILFDNLETLFQEERISMGRRAGTIIGKYARYNEIQNFIDETVRSNQDIASSYVAGKSYEKRDLTVVVLKTDKSKRSIWLDCGIHAREWVTPSTCIYFINQLIEDYKANDPTVVALLEQYEFHVLPLVNPDGYEYSHTTYRLWRKNRAPVKGWSCIGTDLNRNFGYYWFTGGSSNNPCSDSFAGLTADSELETKAIEAAILSKGDNWDSFFTIHSFGQWWLTPWGFSQTERPDNYDDLIAKGKIGGAALTSVYGANYTYGTVTEIVYVASGGSLDWALGKAKIPYSYCLELRPTHESSDPDSKFGFVYPESKALAVAIETYKGLIAFFDSIKK